MASHAKFECANANGKDFQLKSLKLSTTLYIVHESYRLCLLFLMNFCQFWSSVWFNYDKEQLEHIHCKTAPFVLHGRKSKRFGMTCGMGNIKTVTQSDSDSSERLLDHTCFLISMLSFFLSFFPYLL